MKSQTQWGFKKANKQCKCNDSIFVNYYNAVTTVLKYDFKKVHEEGLIPG